MSAGQPFRRPFRRIVVPTTSRQAAPLPALPPPENDLRSSEPLVSLAEMAAMIGCTKSWLLAQARLEGGAPNFAVPTATGRIKRKFSPTQVLRWFQRTFGKNQPTSRILRPITI